jgi:hypothetical protein
MNIKILFKILIAKILIIVLFLKIMVMMDFQIFLNLCSYLLLYQILIWDIIEKDVIYNKIL